MIKKHDSPLENRVVKTGGDQSMWNCPKWAICCLYYILLYVQEVVIHFFSNLLYKMGNYVLDRQYMHYYESALFCTNFFPYMYIAYQYQTPFFFSFYSFWSYLSNRLNWPVLSYWFPSFDLFYPSTMPAPHLYHWYFNYCVSKKYLSILYSKYINYTYSIVATMQKLRSFLI